MTLESLILADSPIVFYKHDETSGTTQTDSSGNSRNGTYTGTPTLNVAGLVSDGGTAVTYNGSTQYSTTAANAAFVNLGSVTIVAVVKSTATSGTIFCMAGSTTQVPWRLGFTTGKAFMAAGTGTETLCTGTSAVNDGTTHLIAGVWDGSNLRIRVGATTETTVAKAGTVVNTNNGLHVAQRNSDSFWAGTVDYVALFSGDIGNTKLDAYAAALNPGSSGTASLSLSASGAAKAPTAGSGSLSLSASAAGNAPITATASLSFSANGSVKAPATGAASITLTATGTVDSGAQAATGDAALNLSASGSGQAATTGLAAITLSASGTTAGQIVGLAAFELSASAVAAGVLSGSGTIDLIATGLVAAPLGGSALLVLSAEGSAHQPFRDVKVFAILDVSRLITITDNSRSLLPVDHPRELVITDRSL